MTGLTREHLVALVTQEVLRALAAEQPRPAALLVGGEDHLPASVRERYRFVALEGGGSWETVVIASLTTAQLADIALGRDEGPVQSAVIQALLDGKEIHLCADALPHRAAGRGCQPAFFRMLEGYVDRLLSFGVQLLEAGGPCEPATAPAVPAGGVVTEALARELVLNGGGPVALQKGAVLTPSAKDVFSQAGREVQFV